MWGIAEWKFAIIESSSVFSTSNIMSSSTPPPCVPLQASTTPVSFPTSNKNLDGFIGLLKPSSECHHEQIMVIAYVHTWKSSCFDGFDTRLDVFPHQDILYQSVVVWWFPSGLFQLHLCEGLWVSNTFVITRLLYVANARRFSALLNLFHQYCTQT